MGNCLSYKDVITEDGAAVDPTTPRPIAETMDAATPDTSPVQDTGTDPTCTDLEADLVRKLAEEAALERRLQQLLAQKANVQTDTAWYRNANVRNAFELQEAPGRIAKEKHKNAIRQQDIHELWANHRLVEQQLLAGEGAAKAELARLKQQQARDMESLGRQQQQQLATLKASEPGRVAAGVAAAHVTGVAKLTQLGAEHTASQQQLSETLAAGVVQEDTQAKRLQRVQGTRVMTEGKLAHVVRQVGIATAQKHNADVQLAVTEDDVREEAALLAAAAALDAGEGQQAPVAEV